MDKLVKNGFTDFYNFQMLGYTGHFIKSVLQYLNLEEEY